MFTPLENLIIQQKKRLNKISFLELIFLTGFKKMTLGIIKIYQDFLSPNLASSCRFYPSCSSYSRQVIEKYGITKGLWFSIKRLLRCNPWSKGGIYLP